MNELKSIEARTILVRLLIHPVYECVYPAGNRTATTAIYRQTTHALALAGITISQGDCGFPLNNAFFLYATSDWRGALAIIKRELAEIGLLQFAQIGWVDNDEGIIRLYYPDRAEPFFKPSPSEFAEETSKTEALIRKLKSGDHQVK